MRVYKFKSTVDADKYAFILAKTEIGAALLLSTKTSVEFELVESKNVEELDKPIVIFNSMLPF